MKHQKTVTALRTSEDMIDLYEKRGKQLLYEATLTNRTYAQYKKSREARLVQLIEKI